jgi:subtilisin family serine protease
MRAGACLAAAALLLSAARAVRAGSPDASLLLAPGSERLLEALGGRGAVPRLVMPPHVQSATNAGTSRSVREIVRARARVPGSRVEVDALLHPLLDRAAAAVVHPRTRGLAAPSGRGVVVGVVDTGFDLAHADLRDATGKTRARWVLDLTQPPRGTHGALEARFGLRDAQGNVVRGAVFDAGMIDDALTSERSPVGDEEGHGTHVASLAAGSPPVGAFVGMAPAADLVLVRVAGGAYPEITAEAVTQAAAFVFDRADATASPAVLNLSIGTDFGPHDGSLAWEQALAAHVGPAKPGRAIVVAAGNGGRIANGVHQTVALSARETAVPLALGSAREGVVRVWATASPGSTMRIGVRVDDVRRSIPPLAYGYARAENGEALATAVLHGGDGSEEIPSASRSAIVLVTGRFGAAPRVVVEGEGRADLWFDAAAFRGQGAAGFRDGVRAGTVTEPAVHPALLAVGCTVTRGAWSSVSGNGPFGFSEPVLDARGGTTPTPLRMSPVSDGAVCDFSAVGPNMRGDAKPDILAPGLAIAGAMSAMARPGTLGSMFTATCMAPGGILDSRCLQADASHAFAVGTSMAAPIVAGAIALLFEQRASLTSEDVKRILQRSAHRPRSGSASDANAFPGELDIAAALALATQGSSTCTPIAERSWLAPSQPYVAATGTEGARVRVQARCDDGSPANVTRDRVVLYGVLEGGTRVDAEPVEDGLYRLPPIAGRAGETLVVRAEQAGVLVAPPLALPVGAGPWDARYGLSLAPSCAASPPLAKKHATRSAWLCVGAVAVVITRRRCSRSAKGASRR